MATGRIGTTPVLQVRWSKAPNAGTTSLSGLDDNSVSLVYSVGYEAVYRNGVLLSRGNDYTATNGTTVTLIDATLSGDIIEIFATQTVPLTDTYSKTVADAKYINNTLTTTTGDIIYASAANTPARLAIGSSGQVLTVSGGLPSYATPASASFVGCRLFQSTGQSVATGTNVTLNFNSESFDTDAFHSTSSNTSRITIPAGKGGKYLFIFNFVIGANSSGKREMKIMKNGNTTSFINGAPPSLDEFGGTLTLVDDAVATDYYEVLVNQSSGSTLTTVSGAPYTQFTAIYLGA